MMTYGTVYGIVPYSTVLIQYSVSITVGIPGTVGAYGTVRIFCGVYLYSTVLYGSTLHLLTPTHGDGPTVFIHNIRAL